MTEIDCVNSYPFEATFAFGFLFLIYLMFCLIFMFFLMMHEHKSDKSKLHLNSDLFVAIFSLFPPA